MKWLLPFPWKWARQFLSPQNLKPIVVVAAISAALEALKQFEFERQVEIQWSSKSPLVSVGLSRPGIGQLIKLAAK